MRLCYLDANSGGLVAGNFFTELRRRNVFRVAAAYVVVAWLIMQVVGTLVPLLGVPGWVGPTVFIFIVAGFPVVLVIAWAFELTPEGLRPTTPRPDGAAAPQARRGLARSWDFVIIGALVIGLGLALGNRVPPATEPSLPSVAVLPFTNLSSDPEQTYFSDGLAEELLSRLARLDGLRVPSRTSSFLFKDSTKDTQTIASELGVATVLEGGVRKSGSQLRITVQLVDGSTGYQIWANTYDRELEDVLVIQEELAESVVSALSITLGVGESERLKTGTRSIEAYDHYLSAISLLNELGTSETTEAIGDLQRAIELDPNYASALSLLSVAFVQEAYTVTGNFESAKDNARRTALRALAIDEDLAAAHAALGHTHFLEDQWARAEDEFNRAVSVPSDFVATWDYADLLSAAGYLEEALGLRRQTRQMLPLNVAPAADLAFAYHLLGQDREAQSELERAADLIGSKGLLVGPRTALAMGAHDDAALRANLARAVDETSGIALDVITTLIAILDGVEPAAAALRRLVVDWGASAQLFGLSGWAAYFGEPELAIELLADTVRRVPSRLDAVWQPIMREARRTSDFKILVRELGLVEYWRARGWPSLCRPLGANDFECD